ncbi:MAG: RNA-binding protein [Planctomycetes bacterium]|nr:RNA-binding protein [Planctomycetota bacterium]
MNIYIGNMSYETTEADLRLACEAFGKVESVSIIKDKITGQPKGFAFVEMPSKSEGQAAIDGLNGKELNERVLNVNEARPRSETFGGSFDKFGSSKRGSSSSKSGYGGGKGGYGSKGGSGGGGSRKGTYGGGKGSFKGNRGGRGR